MSAVDLMAASVVGPTLSRLYALPKRRVDIAKELRVDQQTIYYWKSGGGVPLFVLLIKLIDYLDGRLVLSFPDEPEVHNSENESAVRKSISFINRVERRVNALGLTGADLARKLNISRQAVNSWFKKTNQPSTMRFFSIVHALGGTLTVEFTNDKSGENGQNLETQIGLLEIKENQNDANISK